ncbi:hypothetical protein FJV41_02720 [Myxococcus llanfairpwllgwyngyllgogerychwyrndrobwllllantysiliogogogochensis]|uniref:Uncharacterized protein n=1 Tax=Myxococcus llanfairpwllgwyngyllgogerychwyrndrobwllllantysiliogogogochensis TaxID=2590453 RepID=A0A540X8U6_9BACT|nr:hypothetical protein [Myxococcus llanfairpwllgwyngyllgogerychwyrndrobwllllantysiliogogogochensis]TQF17538.1 hypothetical protein FJV41_02720 [Myxococcus llanfairpwllgwyngyllgogerychwyrndrobwllllantysiliogogogochensis]
MHTPPMPPPDNRRTKSPLLIAAGVGLLVVLGLAMMLLRGGRNFARTSEDVGGLAELASIQSQLQPLDACRIEYGARRGGRQVFGSSDSVKVFSCAESSEVVGVDVPVERRTEGVTFDMARQSRAEPWEVLVDKDRVALPALKGALEQLAPLILEQYPPVLLRQREQREAYDRELKARKDAQQAREQGARDSYPR